MDFIVWISLNCTVNTRCTHFPSYVPHIVPLTVTTTIESSFSRGKRQIWAHMESLKLPTTPGDSPGVGFLKQGLLALQRIPWSQGSVPADGMALLGKWPADREKQEVTQCLQQRDNINNKMTETYLSQSIQRSPCFTKDTHQTATLQQGLMGDVVTFKDI